MCPLSYGIRWVSDTFGRKYTLVLLFTWLAISFTLYQFVGKSLAILVIMQLVTGLAINGAYPGVPRRR